MTDMANRDIFGIERVGREPDSEAARTKEAEERRVVDTPFGKFGDGSVAEPRKEGEE